MKNSADKDPDPNYGATLFIKVHFHYFLTVKLCLRTWPCFVPCTCSVNAAEPMYSMPPTTACGWIIQNNHIFMNVLYCVSSKDFGLVCLYVLSCAMYRNGPRFSDRQVWANSADQDQTAPRGSVWSGSSLFAIPTKSFGDISLLYSPAEIQDDLAIASIENVFIYSDRWGHSDLRSDWCQSGILGQFKMAAKIQDGRQKQGKLAEILEWKIISLMDYILCQVDSLSNILYHFDHIKSSKWSQNPRWPPKKR